jgi:hypothetical protein
MLDRREEKSKSLFKILRDEGPPKKIDVRSWNPMLYNGSILNMGTKSNNETNKNQLHHQSCLDEQKMFYMKGDKGSNGNMPMNGSVLINGRSFSRKGDEKPVQSRQSLVASKVAYHN